MIATATWAAISAGVNLVGALASGHANEIKQFNQIDQQKDDLDKNYEQSKLELKTEYNQSKNSLNYNIGYTNILRNQNANTAAFSNTKNNQFMYEDLSQMLEEVVGSQGQAVQNASLTGFRKTGTQQESLDEVDRAKQYQIERAVETIKLNSAQSFAAASENYFSATAQIEQYKTNLANLEENFKNAKTSLENQYTQNKAELDRARDEADYKFWEVMLDVVTLGIAGAGSYIQAYNSDEIAKMNTDLYKEQMKQYQTKTTTKALGTNNSTRITQMAK